MITNNFDFQTRPIAFSLVDWDDRTYRFTYNRPVTPLLQSIETIGLQQLPVLQEKESGRFCIVAGYRRLKALQKMNRETIFCKIVSFDNKKKDLCLYNFFENIDRGFNIVEQSLVVKKLSVFLEEKELIQKVLPFLNLPPRKETIARCLRISEISPSFLPALVQGRLFTETVDTVVRDFFPISHLIFALFIYFHWGFQKQKEFLAELKEICIRRNEEPGEFLSSLSMKGFFHYAGWTPQQKGEALRQYFRICLYPILTETEKRFNELLATLNLDHRTRLYPPPYFEGGRYGLDIGFRKPEELKMSLRKIHQILEEEKLNELP